MSPSKQPSRKSRTTPTPRATVPFKEVDPELDISFKLAAAIFSGLALVYFAPAFFPGRGIFGTDYLAGGYQFMEFLSNQLRSGVIPKWVPYVYGGVPLHAIVGTDALDPFGKRMIDLMRVFEATDLDAMEVAGETLGRELAEGLA